MHEPVWIAPATVEQIHERCIAGYGGASGIHDEGLLQSALERPKNLWFFSHPKPDLAALAASLTHGIVKNHPFLDGNKRTAWVLCRLLLKLHGQDVVATQNEKLDAMLSLASSDWTEAEFASSLREKLINVQS